MAEKLTKTLIDAMPLAPDGKQVTVMDTVTPGFGLRVGSTSKTFIVVKRPPHGNPVRVTLGKYGALTLESARKMAQDTFTQLANGVELNANKKAVKQEKKKEAVAEGQTLQWLFDEYKAKHLVAVKGGRDGTLTSMNDCLKMFGERECPTLKFNPKRKVWDDDKVVTLESWLERPLRSISDREVLERFEVMEVTRPQKLIGGVLQPMVRTHQVAYKFAQSSFEWFIPRNYSETQKTELLENPFHILKVFSKWKPVGIKTRIVDFQDAEQFGTWWNALESYREVVPVAADYIQFSILQAGRSIEIVNMTWDMVDFKKSCVVYEKTKNDNDYIVPLSKAALKILERRRKDNPKKSKWVWDYPESSTGHIPKDTKHHFHKLEEYGAKYVSTHDLKRTWASAVNSLGKFGDREIDYLLKHTRNDVGVHYFVKNKPLLLNIMQEVEDLFLGLVAEHNQKLSESHG